MNKTEMTIPIMVPITGHFKKPLLQALLLAALAAAGHIIAYKITHLPDQLEIVVIFAACMFYPVFRHPLFGVYLIFTVMPFISFFRRLFYLSYSRPSADPLIIVGDIIMAFMLIGLFFEFRDRNQNENYMRRLSVTIFLYFVYLIVRTPVLNVLPIKEAFLRFRFYGPPVLLFFIGAFYATRLRHFKALWTITAIIGVTSALYGLKQVHLGYSEAEKIWFSSISFSSLFIKGMARPFSFFQSPASFADYMQLTLIAVIILLSWDRKPVRFMWLAVLPLMVYGALITSVRSNWIGIVISFVAWATVIRVKGLRNRVLTICALLLAFALLNVFENSLRWGSPSVDRSPVADAAVDQRYLDLLVTERVSAISNPFEEHSLLSRLALWKFILILARDPMMALFGRGVGALNADSLYVTYLAEFGFPGLVFIIFITVFFIARGFRLLDTAQSPSVIALAKGVTVMNLAWAVVNITGTHIHSFPGDSYYWFWNGVILKYSAMGDNLDKELAHADSIDT